MRGAALRDGQQGGLPGEAEGVVGPGVADHRAQAGQEFFGIGGVPRFAGVFDEAPTGGPERLAGARATRAGGLFDHGRHAFPSRGVVTGLEQAEHALMEGLLCQPDIRGFLLQAGVGFFGEREILGEEEAVRGGDAEAGPLRLDAGIGERRQVGGGQTEGTIAPGRDGQGARRLAREGTGGNVLQ